MCCGEEFQVEELFLRADPEGQGRRKKIRRKTAFMKNTPYINQ